MKLFSVNIYQKKIQIKYVLNKNKSSDFTFKLLNYFTMLLRKQES